MNSKKPRCWQQNSNRNAAQGRKRMSQPVEALLISSCAQGGYRCRAGIKGMAEADSNSA